MKSYAKVPSQYGIVRQPITLRAYFRLNSLSSTGKVINREELKQKAKMTNKDININLKYCI